SWEIECNADVVARIKRLETAKLSRLELYEELIELMLVLEVYWRGLAPERQQRTAKEIREVLRKCEALKERMQDWARKELARRTKPDAFKLSEDLRKIKADWKARHPKFGSF